MCLCSSIVSSHFLRLISSSALSDTYTQVVLIPTWICLFLLVIGLVVYGVFRCCLIVAEEDQEVARLQKPLTVVLLISLSLITLCVIVFLVSCTISPS